MDSSRRRIADAATLPPQTAPDVEELQAENIQRGPARRQLNPDEKRPQDFPLPLEVSNVRQRCCVLNYEVGYVGSF